jgi:hypothetical protein
VTSPVKYSAGPLTGAWLPLRMMSMGVGARGEGIGCYRCGHQRKRQH